MSTTPTEASPITTATRSADAAGAPRPVHTLGSLAMLSTDSLTDIYQSGGVPDSLAALDGEPICRMLTLVGPPGRGMVAAALRRFAAARYFPWAGKTFAARDDGAGVGHNRVRLLGTRDWFRFDTRVQASAIDGQPCIVLDYDKPENPWFIRRIHDELREVSGRVFLGPAMWKSGSDRNLLLYFACDHSGR